MLMKLNSSKVTWLSFLIIVIVAIGFGFVGNRQIVKSLEEQFLAHGAAHNQEVALGLLPLLQTPLRTGRPHEKVIGQFQSALAHPHHLNGYNIFLVDADRSAILASSLTQQVSEATSAGELRKWLIQFIAEAKAGQLSHPWTVHEETKGNRTLLSSLIPVMEGASEPNWLLIVCSDITELMSTMHDLHYRLSGMLLLTVGLVATGGFLVSRRIGRAYERYLEDTVHERTGQLEAAHAEMLRKARLVTLGQTASVLAHEIRNPLASIKLSLSRLMSAGYLQERDSRRVGIALREVDRLNAMLSDALDCVRPIRLSKEPIALDRLVDSVLRLVEPSLLERKLRLNRRDCPECPGARMDPNQMEQVLLNLLQNAIEASPEGGQIDVTVSAEDAWLYFDITNQGMPISPADLDKLFEPFYTSKPKGTGLGLTLVKRVIEEHGGEVCVNSAQAGTHVGFKLPASTKAEQNTLVVVTDTSQPAKVNS